MTDLYYVESPLQLLTALDARKTLSSSAVLIVKIAPELNRTANNDQLMALIQEEDWLKVHFARGSEIRVLDGLIMFLRILKYYWQYKNKIKRYFIGDLRSINMAVLAKSIRPEETVLLDDGAFTIIAQLHFIKNKIIPYNSDKLICKVYEFLQSIDLSLPTTPNLYSFFNFDELLVDGQVNYHKDKTKRHIQVEPNDVYFFGSKFSEAGILTEDAELMVIEETFKLYVNKKIYYIPHRDEEVKKLEMVKQFGGQILNLDGPAENFFDTTNVMPKIVVACYSTVLYSCFSRFSNVKTVAIDIRPLLLLESIKQNVENVYRYYEKTGIAVEYVQQTNK
jgi:hypothetical protein